MQVIVDSSIWIDYFRNGKNSGKLDDLIDRNLIVINDLILAEIVPFLKVKNQQKIISLLNSIKKLDLIIHWNQIIDYQYKCLKKGINGIGLPDLIIAQNAIQNHCEIYTLDNHFKLMKDAIKFKLTRDLSSNHKQNDLRLLITMLYTMILISPTLKKYFAYDLPFGSFLLSAISFYFNSMCSSTPSSYKSRYHLKINFVKDQGLTE
jgi:predicted nucleic acid-binding protein